MVEGESQLRGRLHPLGRVRIPAAAHARHQVRAEEGVEGHADHAHARIAIGRAEGPELFEVHVAGAQPGLLLELAADGRLQALALLALAVPHPNEPARQGPVPLERGLGTADEQNAQQGINHRERDHVDGHRGPRKVTGAIGSEERSLLESRLVRFRDLRCPGLLHGP